MKTEGIDPGDLPGILAEMSLMSEAERVRFLDGLGVPKAQDFMSLTEGLRDEDRADKFLALFPRYLLRGALIKTHLEVDESGPCEDLAPTARFCEELLRRMDGKVRIFRYAVDVPKTEAIPDWILLVLNKLRSRGWDCSIQVDGVGHKEGLANHFITVSDPRG